MFYNPRPLKSKSSSMRPIALIFFGLIFLIGILNLAAISAVVWLIVYILKSMGVV